MRTVGKLTMTLLGTALLGTTLMPQTAKAGDSEWATAGKILTGVVGLHVLSNIANSDRGYTRYETTRYEPRHTTYRETRYVERDCRPTVRVQSYEPPRPVYYGDYYSRRSNVSYYEVERPAPAPQVVYVQSQPAPAPAPQVVYVQSQPAPAPAPAPQVVYVQNESAPAPAPQQTTTSSTNPTGNDVDESIFVVAKVEDGKRIVQPRVRGAAATMQMWSDVHKEWVDIKTYPSIY